jgi:hypothetical protein
MRHDSISAPRTCRRRKELGKQARTLDQEGRLQEHSMEKSFNLKEMVFEFGKMVFEFGVFRILGDASSVD